MGLLRVSRLLQYASLKPCEWLRDCAGSPPRLDACHVVLAETGLHPSGLSPATFHPTPSFTTAWRLCNNPFRGPRGSLGYPTEMASLPTFPPCDCPVVARMQFVRDWDRFRQTCKQPSLRDCSLCPLERCGTKRAISRVRFLLAQVKHWYQAHSRPWSISDSSPISSAAHQGSLLSAEQRS